MAGCVLRAIHGGLHGMVYGVLSKRPEVQYRDTMEMRH
jgi:hypothetical protein